jgi:hypothetical protein
MAAGEGAGAVAGAGVGGEVQDVAPPATPRTMPINNPIVKSAISFAFIREPPASRLVQVSLEQLCAFFLSRAGNTSVDLVAISL